MSGLSPAQVELRRTRIGTSEIGALLGLDPHKTPTRLYFDRVAPEVAAQAEAQEEEEAEREAEHHQTWGLDAEKAILAHYGRRTGLAVRLTGDKTLTHERAPFLCSTPDAVVKLTNAARPWRVLDAKNVQRFAPSRKSWGQPETGEVPTHYAAQLVGAVGLSELNAPGQIDPCAHLVACIEGAPPEWWMVEYDPDLFGYLHDLAEKFIRDHVLAGKPPKDWEKDRHALDYVAARYRRKPAPDMISATPELTEWCARIAAARAAIKEWETNKHEAQALLCDVIGPHQGVEGLCKWGWIAPKVEKATDWSGVAHHLAAQMVASLKLAVAAEALLAQTVPTFTTERIAKAGYRRLTLTKSKGDADAD